MISVKNLKKTYLLGGEEVHALDDVSLSSKSKSLWRSLDSQEAGNQHL